MITANMPVAGDIANYAHVAAHRATTTPPVPRAGVLWPQVQALYGTYITRMDDVTGPRPHGFALPDHVVLRDNANYLTLAHLKSLRSDILDSAKGLCASCNNVKASDVDHYLPKEHFGEYSVYSYNLTPICSPCNKKKGQRYRREHGGRRYVHPYFDALPPFQYIDCAVTVGLSVTTKFTLSLPRGTPAELSSIMNQHFTDLGLATMYSEEATNEIQARLGSVYSSYRIGKGAEVQSYLRRESRSTAAHYGMNHWQPVTLKALAHSADFCNEGFTKLGEDPLA